MSPNFSVRRLQINDVINNSGRDNTGVPFYDALQSARLKYLFEFNCGDLLISLMFNIYIYNLINLISLLSMHEIIYHFYLEN